MTQSNPVYYSLESLSSGSKSMTRTVILHRRSDHEGFGIYIGEDVPTGLYVVTVERNSPAANANIQPGDRVLAFNGQSVASIQNNPKEKLMQAAANAHSLALTIKSTDLYQSLQLPLINNSTTTHISNNNITDINHQQNLRRYIEKPTVGSTNGLESYIRSLFANENIQILQASIQDDIGMPAVPPRQPINYSKSLPTDSKPKKSHHTHRHKPKRTTLVNVETQTSINNDENESGKKSTEPSSKQTSSSRPNMGVNQMVLKNQSANSTNNRQESVEYDDISLPSSSEEPLLKAKEPEKPRLSEKTDNANNAFTSVKSNDKTAAQPTMSHMADVVQAAIAARNKPNVDNGARIAEKTETDKPSAGTIYTSTTGRNQPQTSDREQVQSSDRDQPKPAGHNQPPLYTEAKTNAVALNNQPSGNEGSYNVRMGQINQKTSPPSGSSMRSLHLVRLATFQGYGFHIQYNKKYYLIQGVESDSPAAIAHLQPNDVILYINGDKTDDMPHATFVKIVNDSQTVDFIVQSVGDYLRANPAASRSHTSSAPTAAQPSARKDDEKAKTGLSKALGKFAIH